ncbi:hypothetical protein CBR_g37979 [Chara braunii]|uniref:Secreted protein n=1 Tax=Chara braunii TaxID=69332 RepID=A0A388LP75_CHABU|nr:hypothetical protein CBR_g37979 [Chara braunii]|eukprot:GBG84104.1 hypothetical protein CBR_g37979 [Chara braunii]
MLLLFACSVSFNDLQCARGQEEDTYPTPTFPGYCSTAVPRLPWASLQEVGGCSFCACLRCSNPESSVSNEQSEIL